MNFLFSWKLQTQNVYALYDYTRISIKTWYLWEPLSQLRTTVRIGACANKHFDMICDTRVLITTIYPASDLHPLIWYDNFLLSASSHGVAWPGTSALCRKGATGHIVLTFSHWRILWRKGGFAVLHLRFDIVSLHYIRKMLVIVSSHFVSIPVTNLVLISFYLIIVLTLTRYFNIGHKAFIWSLTWKHCNTICKQHFYQKVNI